MPEPEDEEEADDEQDNDLFAYASSKRKRIVQERPSPRSSHVKKAIAEKATAAGAAVKGRSAGFADTCRQAAETLSNRVADIRWGDAPLKVIGIVIGILVVLLFVVSGVSNCIGRHDTGTVADNSLELAIDPPEPYFD